MPRTKRRQRRVVEAKPIIESVVGARAGMRYYAPDRDTRAMIDRLTSWVYVAVDRNATEVSRYPAKLYSRKRVNSERAFRVVGGKALGHLKATAPSVPDDVVEILEHEVLDLLDRPNPLLMGSSLLWLMSAYIDVFGRCYVYKHRDGLEQPKELWPLPNQYMVPVLGTERIIDYYELRYRGAVQQFAADDVIDIRKPSPFDMVGALSNVIGVLHAAEANARMKEWLMAIFQNFAVPDLLVSPTDDSDITQAQIDTLSASWNARYGGWRNRGKMAVAPFPLKVEQLGFNAREMRLDESDQNSRREILAGLGVPDVIVDAGGATFANLYQATVLWARNKIQPMQTLIANALNVQLMCDYQGIEQEAAGYRRSPLFLAFDNPVPEDEELVTRLQNERVAGGLAAINEIRAERGEEPVDGGDEIRIQAGLVRLTDPTASDQWQAAREDGASRWAQEREDGIAAREQQNVEPAPAVGEEQTISFNEITLAIERLTHIGDLDGVNICRQAMAQMLGVTIPALDAIQASGTAGAVGEEAENGKAEQQGKPTDSTGEHESTTQDDAEDQAGDRGAADRPERPGKSAKADTVCECHTRGLASGDESRNGNLLKAIDEAANKMAPGEELGPVDGFALALARLFGEMQDAVLEKLRRPSKAVGDVDIEQLFDQRLWVDRFAHEANPYLARAFEAGGLAGARTLVAQYAVFDDPTAILLDAQAVKAEVAKLADTFASVVVQVTGEELAETLGRGLEAGENIEQLAQRVGELYGEKRDKHARLIARTEFNNAANAAAAATWKKAGVKQHRWLAAMDSCEFCLALDGQVRDIGQPFVRRGQTLTGVDGGRRTYNYKDVLQPALHPNDRCTIVPVIEELEPGA